MITLLTNQIILKMRKYSYIILATLLFITGVANIYAQVPEGMVDEETPYSRISVYGVPDDPDHPQPVLYGNICHAIEGTEIHIAFPADKSIKKNGSSISNEDILTAEKDTMLIYQVDSKYCTIWFKVYDKPIITKNLDISASLSKDYTIQSDSENDNFTAQFNFSEQIRKPSSSSIKFKYKIEWQVFKDGTEFSQITDTKTIAQNNSIINEEYSLPTNTLGKYTVTAVIKLLATPNTGAFPYEVPYDETIWGTQTVSKTITVYDKPNVSEITLGLDPDKGYTYQDGESRNITATYTSTPQALSHIEWFVDNVKVSNASGDTFEFNPQNVEVSGDSKDVTIKAVVSILSPDNETWESKTNEKTIRVYPNPVEVVTETILKQKVTQPDSDPQKIIAYEGQNGVSFTYSVVEDTPDERYKWEYKWVLGKDTISENNSVSIDNDKQVLKATNNQITEYSVKLFAQAYNPDPNLDDEQKEAWGEPIECTLSPITIYPAPNYKEKDLHETPSTPIVHEYAIFDGQTFDASKLYTTTIEGSNKMSGYPTGWNAKLYVDGNLQTDMPFTPTEAKDYTLTLVVTNTAPTGKWSETETTYTLHVYDKPVWDATDIADKFNENDTVLNVETGDALDITAKLTKGNANWWNVKCSVNNGAAKSFTGTSNERTYKHIFELTGEEPQEIPLKIDISYDYEKQYLLMGQNNVIDNHIKDLPKSIERTIVVWDSITAKIAAVNEDFNVIKDENDNVKYVLETREKYADEQTIEINLVGGDLGKWEVEPQFGDNPEFELTKNEAEDTLTFTIQGETLNELKANGSKEEAYDYSFHATYQDGQTKRDTTFNLSIIVYPEPKITNQTLALSNKDVSYKEQSGKYTVDCYQGDELQLSVTPTGGKINNESWKYQIVGTNQKTPINGSIDITGQGTKTIKIFNYLNNGKEKLVKEVTTAITRHTEPSFDIELPIGLDNTEKSDWTNAEVIGGKPVIPVDLYGGKHVATFAITGSNGLSNGWSYDWTGASQITGEPNKGQYTASTTNASEEHDISVNIVNKIPGDGTNQIGDNIGLNETKVYRVRVWHPVIFPPSYILMDPQNSFYEGGNNVYETKSIREGNKLVAKIEGIQYGYTGTNSNGGYRYAWEGQGSKNQSSWEAIVTNTVTDGKLNFSVDTLGLTVENKGPRGTTWDSCTFDTLEVKIFNRPKTPTKLEKKGNGTSHTMIIEYADISDEELIIRGDYFINFWYTNPNGDTEIASKQQQTIGDIRWATGYANAEQMNNAFVYANWLDATNGVLITSGKRTLTGVDEDWDMSNYGLSPKQITQIRALTRAGNGDFYNIINLEDYDDIDLTDGEIRVYNLNGMMVGTSTDNLPSGIYVVHYLQNGSKRTKKLSVK